MTHEDAFLAAIVASPEDDAPRLIYADWLDEQGQKERAEFIRVQCKIAAINREIYSDEDCGSPDCSACQERKLLQRRERELLEKHKGWLDPKTVPVVNPIASSKPALSVSCGSNGAYGPPIFHFFRRGFIEKIECPCQQWLTRGGEMLRACPTIREVRLSDRVPQQRHGDKLFWWTNHRGDDRLEMESDLPACIYLFFATDILPAYPDPRGGMGGSAFFDSNRRAAGFLTLDYAVNALSSVCLAFARQQLAQPRPLRPQASAL